MSVNPNIDVVREVFGRVVYSHKTHEKDRELSSAKVSRIRWTNIILTALTFGGIVSNAIWDQRVVLFATIAIGTVTLAFTVFQLSFDPATDAARHRVAAKSLLLIREKYVNLLADIYGGIPDEEIQKRRDDLQEELNEVYEQAPDTSYKAYSRAKTALKVNEELTFSDSELDLFLPKSLRSTYAR